LEHASRDHLPDLLALVFEQEMAFAWIGVTGLKADGAQLFLAFVSRRIKAR
jgi:hypothetical protein